MLRCLQCRNQILLFSFLGPPAAVVTPVAATPVVTTTGLPVQPAAVQQLQLQQQQLQQQQLQQQQLVQQQQLQQQQLQQQQSAQVIAQQQAEVRAKIEEETQRKVAESSISHEENMSISGSNARYMVMQKLSRKSEVSGVQQFPSFLHVGEVTCMVELCLVLMVLFFRMQSQGFEEGKVLDVWSRLLILASFYPKIAWKLAKITKYMIIFGCRAVLTVLRMKLPSTTKAINFRHYIVHALYFSWHAHAWILKMFLSSVQSACSAQHGWS